jgi:hypothetical protein
MSGLCTTCGKDALHRSQRRSSFEVALSLAFIYPYRCGACRRRQFHLNRWRLLTALGVSAPILTAFGMFLVWVASSGSANAMRGRQPMPALISVSAGRELVLDVGNVAGNAEIVRLARSGVNDSVIRKVIGRAACRFQLDTAALIELRKAGVSSDVIAAMIDAMAVDPMAQQARSD